MRIRTTAVLATSLAVLALSACNSPDEPAAGSTVAGPVSSAPPSPSTSPTRAAPLAFSQTLTTSAAEDGSVATATVIGYQQGVTAQQGADEENGTDGYVWAAVELKVCSAKGTIITSRFPWVLSYSDGARIEPSGTTFGDFPKPEYPIEATVKEGDCVRGKTVYAVPAAQRPAKVLYTTKLLAEPAEWAVPTA
ncbi:hypothetical protein AB0O18_31410 [Streptomyces sp. NPDC093224]|uniref:hypothetical protein n=1 Tax=Streptomyces sp. NPDC093224 TaxID=3155198 RepID=UPI003430DAF7